MFLPKVYQLLLKILQKKQVVYYNRYISIQNNESEDLIMFEMVCWDCGKHHFYKMADDKKSFIKVDKL